MAEGLQPQFHYNEIWPSEPYVGGKVGPRKGKFGMRVCGELIGVQSPLKRDLGMVECQREECTKALYHSLPSYLYPLYLRSVCIANFRARRLRNAGGPYSKSK